MIVELNSGNERDLADWLRQQAGGLSDIVRRLSLAWCSGISAGGPFGLQVAGLAGQSAAVCSSLSTTGGQLVNIAGELDDVAGNADAADGGGVPSPLPFTDPGGADHRLDQSWEWDLMTWWRRDGVRWPGGFTADGFAGVRGVLSMGDSHYNSDQIDLAPSLSFFAGIMGSASRTINVPGGILDLNADGGVGLGAAFSPTVDIGHDAAKLGESESVTVGPFVDASTGYNTNNFGIQVTGEAGIREDESASVGLSADTASSDLLHVEWGDQEVLGAHVDFWVRIPKAQSSGLVSSPPLDPAPNTEPAIAAWWRHLQEQGDEKAPNPPKINPLSHSRPSDWPTLHPLPTSWPTHVSFAPVDAGLPWATDSALMRSGFDLLT